MEVLSLRVIQDGALPFCSSPQKPVTHIFYSKRENYMDPVSKASDITHVTSSKAIQKKT